MSHSRIIGQRFEIGPLAGQGGMGSVYQGVDTVTGEAVAIKLLKPELVTQDPEMVERFAREGEALRKLNHPSIVKVLAAFEENGEHFLIMEYVAGGSLRDLLDEHGALPIKRVLEIALDLADALTRAHRLKIIHRDIKPPNVLLAEDGTPRLTDFGVARLGDSTRMTQTGSMIGTLAYLSPEACAGLQPDGRTDIWSFGVMLYEMLTGKRPFEADNTAALLTAILTKPAPPLQEYRPDVPLLLAGLIDKMLVKERDERISSIRLVGAELEAIMAGAQHSTLDNDEWRASSADVVVGESRFDTPTPSTTAHLQTNIDPSKQSPVITSPQGQEFVVVAKRSAALSKLAAFIIMLVLAGAVGLLLSQRASSPAENDPKPDDVISIAPVEIGQDMVLVAQFEHVGGPARDVQRFIVNDLKRQFEEDIPFSVIRVRAYPRVVSSKAEARAAAEAAGARVIIWGNYNANTVQAELELGDPRLIKTNVFPLQDIETMLSLRVQMTDERSESLALPVLSLFQALYSYESLAFSVARNSAIGELINPALAAQAIGSSTPARWSRMFALFVHEPEKSLDEIDAAINLDSRNPLLYLARSLILQKLGQPERGLEDARTAQRLGPDNWGIPLWQFANDALYLRNDPDAALPYFEQILKINPDDPFALLNKGWINYLNGDIDSAKIAVERTLEIAAQNRLQTNFPYLIAMEIALREGRWIDAQKLLAFVLKEFPDPTFSQRIFSVSLGTVYGEHFVTLVLSAFGNLTLGQWSRVIEDVDKALASGLLLGDLYFMKGLALCNLRNYPAAEAAYTAGLEAEPDLNILYALRAEVRQRQGNTIGALADTRIVLQSELGPLFAPLIPALSSGLVSCENLFEVDLSEILGTDGG